MIATGSLSWDLIDSSQSFSTFSAVLAAFMFAAIVLLLTREVHLDADGTIAARTDSPGVIARPIALMLGALFQLLIAAFLFAAMAGDTVKGGFSQFIQGTMPCLALSVGVVEMAVALAWLFYVRQLLGSTLQLAGLVVDGTIAIAAVFLSGVVLSPIFEHLTTSGLPGNAGQKWLVMTALISLSIPIGRIARRYITTPIAGRDQWLGEHIVRLINVISVGVGVTAAVSWNVLTTVPEADVKSAYNGSIGTVAIASATALIIVLFATLEAAVPRSTGGVPGQTTHTPGSGGSTEHAVHTTVPARHPHEKKAKRSR